MDHWGLASEIATAAPFLASDDASCITGHTLPVDGGYCIGYSGIDQENMGTPKG
jgi:NAD(P)-dependent dehydrogenase (short-subunit alcohol dehydrogenase family)